MALFTLILIALSSYASASRILQSNSLNPCPGAKNLGLSATLFNVTFNADAKRLDYNINLVSSIGGKVIANIQALAYGFVLLNQTIDPCDKKNTQLQPLCDMTPGNIPPLNSFSALDQSMVDRIPGIAYAVPDLDVKVRITINDQNRQQIACVETALSNGQTVEQLGVKWATAVIAGLGLVASAVTAGLGHSNTAAHVAANAMSLFGLFQAQAMVGMTSISLPPIVQSWTQDFQWTMGIIKIQFMQTIFTWYLRATGGYPSTIVASLAVASVQVQKRSLEVVQKIADKAPLGILKRAVQKQDNDIKVVRGILRVGFRAGIEPTNIFLTGLAFFVAFLCLVILGILFFKGVLEFGTKRGWSDGEKVQEFRVGWKIVLKGILLRIVSLIVIPCSSLANLQSSLLATHK